ncbi:hypothetical protein EPA93_21065 [Ktedonosporobacter rubrisoli]|uniref:Uncharacterized protein n=1 Tax=Ktedonosporobacter rubrisoli TaxID=2509675 RepID=A0A4P6JSU8_KTERU|nr:hypothetical protein [Ktedonosporobacter rubrisoli]QBD78353.1 hypothetical protein EPA93_21065 [Ktedonosporobacter rubrisoli]
MPDYANFRQRLDAVLRTLNVEEVRGFLIAEDQWSEEEPVDPELAMWLMVAGSPSLRDLHEKAREWLVSHGHESEAMALLGKGKRAEARPGTGHKQAAWARRPKGQKSAKPR